MTGGIFIATTASVPTWLAIGPSGQLLYSATSGLPAYSTGVNFGTTARALFAQRIGMTGIGTAWTSNNISLGGGWSTGGALANLRGGDLACSFQILTSGIGAGQPIFTTTYADGLFSASPVTVMMLGTTFTSTVIGPQYTITQNASGLSVQFNSFTATSSSIYTINLVTIG